MYQRFCEKQTLHLAGVMPREDLIIAVCCCIEQCLQAVEAKHPFRQRGCTPQCSDSEVCTMEVVGEFLGIDQEKHIGEEFCRHWYAWFPCRSSRSTVVRHAANLWGVKQRIQSNIATLVGAYADTIHVVDGLPLPRWHRARSKRCTTLREVSA